MFVGVKSREEEMQELAADDLDCMLGWQIDSVNMIDAADFLIGVEETLCQFIRRLDHKDRLAEVGPGCNRGTVSLKKQGKGKEVGDFMELKHVYTPDELEELPKEVARYGVIGYPVTHSLSPQMHHPAFEALKIPAVYPRIEVVPERLKDAVEKMRAAGWKGWNATLPHKIELYDLVDERGRSAEDLKAVNTVLNTDGKLIGFNTDGEGWVRAIREEFGVDVRDLRIMIVGTGGVGQALARQASMEKCERLVLANRTEEKASALAKEISPYFQTEKLLGAQERLKVIPLDEELMAEELNTIDLFVNGTSIGLRSYDPEVVPARILQPHLMVYDTIYRQAGTKLLQGAKEVGCRVANGLSMLLHQGAISFEIWTGEAPPLEVMRRGLMKAASAG